MHLSRILNDCGSVSQSYTGIVQEIKNLGGRLWKRRD